MYGRAGRTSPDKNYKVKNCSAGPPVRAGRQNFFTLLLKCVHINDAFSIQEDNKLWGFFWDKPGRTWNGKSNDKHILTFEPDLHYVLTV